MYFVHVCLEGFQTPSSSSRCTVSLSFLGRIFSVWIVLCVYVHVLEDVTDESVPEISRSIAEWSYPVQISLHCVSFHCRTRNLIVLNIYDAVYKVRPASPPRTQGGVSYWWLYRLTDVEISDYQLTWGKMRKPAIIEMPTTQAHMPCTFPSSFSYEKRSSVR